MKVEVFDNKNKIRLYEADITFGLDTLIVDKSEEISPNKLQDFLTNRMVMPYSVKTDELILKKLNLMNRKYLFGRMNEVCCLYAMLNNFKKDTDELCVYPLKDELLCFIDLDPRYSNIYVWRARKDFKI